MDKFWGQARHIVGAVGAFLVGMGWATADETVSFVESLDVLVGSVGVVGAMVASWIAKIRS